MELKLKRPLVVFDLESTGLNITEDRIIELSYVKVYPDGHEESNTYRFNPEKVIPQQAIDVHHITNEDLKVKTGRDYPALNARFALLDPLYTLSVPRKQFVSGVFDSLSHMMEIYFSAPDTDNVSDSMNEALMQSVIRNLRAALRNPADYNARSNLVWLSTMAENRILKLGKKTDFQCHILEHSLGAYTDCNHGCGLSVLHPVYYRHIYKDGAAKFARFATRVWEIPAEGKSREELAKAGVEALAAFIREIGMPTTLRELGIQDKSLLKPVAAGCTASPGSYRRMDPDEIYQIFQEAF